MPRPVFSCPRADELEAWRHYAPAVGCSCATARVLVLLGVLVGALWVLPSQSLYSESLSSCYGSFLSRPLQAASASRYASLRINLQAVNRFIRFGQNDEAVIFKAICFLFKASFRLPTFISFYGDIESRGSSPRTETRPSRARLVEHKHGLVDRPPCRARPCSSFACRA
ncbi:hypothetical protein T492DRAFT_250720 [Pavlovales sp. CCMP2436]|nr:hypothetical protein T492DRAFT_250720 [Pavlovales sp. CCMP2436]